MGLADCPLCLRKYSQLSQHLTVTHGVKNREERKLLLAIPSGRVDVRKGTCPVPACGMTSSRLDRHLRRHTELTAAARRQAFESLKHRKILCELAKLRASNPAVAMASTLDLHESEDEEEEEEDEDEEEEDESEDEEEEEEDESEDMEDEHPPCDNPRCQREREHLENQIDTLIKQLAQVTRRYVLMKRRSQGAPSRHKRPARPTPATSAPTPATTFKGTQTIKAEAEELHSGALGPAVPAEGAKAAEPVQKRQRKQTNFF